MAFEYYNVFELIYLIHTMAYLHVYLHKHISFVHKTYDDCYIVQSYRIYKNLLAKDIYSIYIYQLVCIEPFCYRVCILNSQTSANYIIKLYIQLIIYISVGIPRVFSQRTQRTCRYFQIASRFGSVRPTQCLSKIAIAGLISLNFIAIF